MFWERFKNKYMCGELGGLVWVFFFNLRTKKLKHFFLQKIHIDF